MARQTYLSPCCRAASRVRAVSLGIGAIALRCDKCGQMRIEKLGQPVVAPRIPPRLRLIVSR